MRPSLINTDYKAPAPYAVREYVSEAVRLLLCIGLAAALVLLGMFAAVIAQDMARVSEEPPRSVPYEARHPSHNLDLAAVYCGQGYKEHCK